MQRRFVQCDAITGEIVEGTMAYMPPKRKNGYTMWIALNQESVDAICSEELSGSDRRVLMALVGAADMENKIMISQTQMAEKLGMAPCNFTRCVSRLVKLGFVVKEEKAGRFQILSLGIQHFWKGDARKHKEMMAEMNKPQRAAAKSSPSPAVP
jgi:predicted transcriptional regulator